MNYSIEYVQPLFDKWIEILRLKNCWDVKLEFMSDHSSVKTGDIKLDPDDRKAVLILNSLNPKQENPEEVYLPRIVALEAISSGSIDRRTH